MLQKFIQATFSTKPFTLLISIALLLLFSGCSITLDVPVQNNEQSLASEAYNPSIDESTAPTSFAEVSHYLREHNKLPANYITKEEARKLGWVAAEGNLHSVAPGKSIGGDRFGNREGLLPKADGRIWYEADIDYEGGTRNAKRIVYSNDGLIYMTTDHYKTFTNITDEGSVIDE